MTISTQDAIEHLRGDAILRNVIDRSEVPTVSRTYTDMYSALLRSIISQQLSGKAAATITGRFLDLFAEQYPHPDRVLALTDAELRAVGLSQQKLGYIRNVAAFAQTNDMSREKLDTMTDEQIIGYLVPIKGVGRWTVEMLLMFAMQRPDVFPVDDLVIRQMIIKLYGVTEKGKAQHEKLTQIAETWRPYRTLACLYLWQWKDKGV